MADNDMFIPIQAIEKKQRISEEDLQSVTVTTDDLRLVLDIWLSAPLRWLLAPLLKIPFYLAYMAYSTVISIAMVLVFMLWSVIFDATRHSLPMAIIAWGAFFVILGGCIVILIIPTPLLLMIDAGIKQGMLRAMQGERLTFMDWVIPDRQYWPRLFVLSTVIVVMDTLLGLSLVGIPLIYIANIVLFATFSYFLLSRPELSIVQIFVFAAKANARNIVPLCIFGGIVLAVSFFGQLSTIANILTIGFITILEFVYAAKITGELVEDGAAPPAAYSAIHTEHFV